MLNFGVSFFITIINFAVLFLVFRRFLWKPVTNFMESRASKVKGELADAAMTKSKAEEMAKRYDSLLAEADSEAERLVKEGEERAKAEAKSIVEAAQAEAAAARRRGEEAAAREHEKARQALSAEIAALAADIAARLVGREARAEDARSAEALVRELEAGRA
ncbi:MAG TPA: ATP synthase F0 subunit B [Rectinemataceae bacterium]|nr:ATP synthase F0 subunit B [Rectinemataceae bacterium]